VERERLAGHQPVVDEVDPARLVGVEPVGLLFEQSLVHLELESEDEFGELVQVVDEQVVVVLDRHGMRESTTSAHASPKSRTRLGAAAILHPYVRKSRRGGLRRRACRSI
jgi:hypothetical protein